MAKAKTPNTPKPTATRSPAPEITQEQAGAGETGSASPAIAALIIASKREGFRRAGRPWSVAPTTVPLAELTDDQVEMLYAEPMLDITAVAAE